MHTYTQNASSCHFIICNYIWYCNRLSPQLLRHIYFIYRYILHCLILSWKSTVNKQTMTWLRVEQGFLWEQLFLKGLVCIILLHCKKWHNQLSYSTLVAPFFTDQHWLKADLKAKFLQFASWMAPFVCLNSPKLELWAKWIYCSGGWDSCWENLPPSVSLENLHEWLFLKYMFSFSLTGKIVGEWGFCELQYRPLCTYNILSWLL